MSFADSLLASLEDANATIARLSAEKSARDRAIAAARDALDAVLAPAATPTPTEPTRRCTGVEAWEDGPRTNSVQTFRDWEATKIRCLKTWDATKPPQSDNRGERLPLPCDPTGTDPAVGSGRAHAERLTQRKGSASFASGEPGFAQTMRPNPEDAGDGA